METIPKPARMIEDGRPIAFEVGNVGDALLATDESLKPGLAVSERQSGVPSPEIAVLINCNSVVGHATSISIET